MDKNDPRVAFEFTVMDTVNLTQTQSQTGAKWREFIDKFPVLHAGFVVFFAVASTYATVQLTQAHQAEKIKKLEETTVSRELFDERTKAILDRLERQDAKLDRIMEK